MIDFTLIKSGEEFEMFCEDLLKAKGYNLASRSARGPDGGKDMIISFEYTDTLGFNERLRILIECKHFAKSNRSVREEDLGNIVERTLANNCNRYLLITSTVPSASVSRQLEGITTNPSIPISATFWAKNDLEKYVLEFPELEKRYFSIGKTREKWAGGEEPTLWNIAIHSHPDFAQELQNAVAIWNKAQNHIHFSMIRPSRVLENQLLSSGAIDEDTAAYIANRMRLEAGFIADDGIIQFCEKRLYGDGYYQLFTSETLHDENPPNTSTISLHFLRDLSTYPISIDTPILSMILLNILHTVAAEIGLDAHDETRGCLMDFDENMTDILIGVRKGPMFCDSCEKQLLRMGASYIFLITKSTKEYLESYTDINKIPIRMNLRDKRRKESGEDWTYDIALSFAGEDRRDAEQLALALRRRNVNVFYDGFEKTQLWGKDLYTYLSDLYRLRAKYCVMFISRFYANKLWTNHEKQAAQARAFTENQTYILPIRLDDTEIPGLLSTIGYLNWRTEGVEGIADLLVQKLQEKYEQLPDGR